MWSKRKSSTILLSALLALMALLAACGNDNNKNGGATEGGTTASPAQANEKTANLKMAYFSVSNTKDFKTVQDAINIIAKEKINATVELMPIDAGSWNQQINLLLAGNEPLDLMLTSTMFNFSNQVAKGQLLPLDELLEKYGPTIKDTMEPAIYNATKIDGKIYGVPSVRDTAADYGLIMRKDLVDKHGIDLSAVKTFADVESILKTIKDKEPGISPLVPRSQALPIVTDILSGSIDMLGDNMGVLPLANNDTKIVNLYETQEYADAVALVRKWYQAGYIMQDAATTLETYSSLVRAGKAFSYFSNTKPGFEQQETGLNGHEMVAVRLTKPVSSSSNATSMMISIPHNSSDPDKAMQLMNLLYTDKEIVNLLTNGVEGKHYVKNEDGTIQTPEGVTDTGYQFNQWEIGNNALSAVWKGTAPDIWEQMRAFNKSATFSKALGFTFDSNSVKNEVAAVTNVVNQYKVGLETGTLDPSTLGDFNGKLKSAGLDKIIAEKQKQLDVWAASEEK
ncbi:ABC transporter substrate-binding protein [Cohnella herbarum]|uniref:ABC transporter substrate-binding protein n=1 Tax=Cohnella herbarum TaxID=2728023 RepID=A0A7Z2ZKJ0_9BACL|nr:ABC transporter substrate-binding protein [Cohnella herbarum]QJD82834.1 ABC transporter substrate-binding protein [Cohnella herbarum]